MRDYRYYDPYIVVVIVTTSNSRDSNINDSKRILFKLKPLDDEEDDEDATSVASNRPQSRSSNLPPSLWSIGVADFLSLQKKWIVLVDFGEILNPTGFYSHVSMDHSFQPFVFYIIIIVIRMTLLYRTTTISSNNNNKTLQIVAAASTTTISAAIIIIIVPILRQHYCYYYSHSHHV